MKRNLMLALIVITLVTTVVFAQQKGRGSGTPPSGPQSVVTGTVVSFNATAGIGTPSLVVNQAGNQMTLVLGPFWFLQNAKFSAAPGDSVEAVVIACTTCPSGSPVLSVKNLTNGSSVTLRNSDGLPLWQSGRQNGGQAMGNGMHKGMGTGMGNGTGDCQGAGPDMSRVATFSGTVASFTGGAGSGRPTLVLGTASGEKTVLVSPWRVVMQAGLQFNPGAPFTVTAAPNANDEWVVITLVDGTTGAELALRDPVTGFPLGGRHGRV